MIYGTPNKGDDGLYFVKALSDEKKKHFVQLNRVNKVTVSGDSNEVTIDMVSEKNTQRIEDIDELNIKSAVENASSWFGKELTEDVIRSAYTSGMVNGQLTCDRIPQTRVFNVNQEVIDISNIKPTGMCTAIVEFAGLWFAKKAFGPVWNLVQVKVFDDPVIEDLYPEEYVIADEDDQ